jgi:peptidoglycan/xylan/chitin deacetylase (PgdA/CDA1 family)
VVALTFDAGANGAGVDGILATLAREHVPASFFLTGQFAKTYPDLAHRMAAAGRLGDHTVTHPHLSQLPDDEIRSQVLVAASTIRATTGREPRPFFRFPYGEYTAHTLALVNGLGFGAIGWTVDSLGWKGTSGGQSVASVASRVVAAATPGEIALMHVGSNPKDGTTLDAQALPAIINALRSRGYSFVTLDALL